MITLTQSTPDDRLATLEARLARVEDELAIHRLLTSYGPLVDAGRAEEVADVWTEDGVYDVDGAYLDGRAQIIEMVQGSTHQGFINNGSAHINAPAHIEVDGDSAIAVCHSLLVLDRDGFKIERATAHHLQLVRVEGSWKVRRRTSRLLNGSQRARDLLAAGATGRPA